MQVDGDVVTVRVEVTNTGDRRGAEVVQCYVAPPTSSRVTRPPKELKAFAKVQLDPGESTTVELTLDARAFAYWDPSAGDRRLAASIPARTRCTSAGRRPTSRTRVSGASVER